MKLTSRELKDFFVGNLLGDAYLKNGSFSVKQISEDLIHFKESIIKRNLPGVKIKLHSYDAYVDKTNINHQKYYVLYVSPHPYFWKLQEEFYPKGKKIVPKKYLRPLSPIGYAMWYADDGTTVLVGKNKTTGSSMSRRVQFCTDNFNPEDVQKLSKMIAEAYGKTSLIKRKKDMYRINIQVQDAQFFIKDIYKFFYNYFPSLLYKMDMGYRGTSLLNKTYVSEDYHNIYLEISAHPSFVDRMANR